MFFSKPDEFEPCGINSIGHYVYIVLTIVSIIIALKCTINKSKNEIKKIIQICTVFLIITEIIKIMFKMYLGYGKYLNEYIPLYYCSLIIYAGILSSFTKGKLERVGNVFIATGGIVGGIVFIIMPTTSLPTYHFFHYISIHSFVYHGIMVYLGLLINMTKYITLEFKDIIYYASFIGISCLIALILNSIYDSNLMFISKDFPGTPIEIICKHTGKFFTVVATIIQISLPYIVVYEIILLNNKLKLKKKE